MVQDVTTIHLLRHGLPEGEGRARGKTDFALTADGFSQMRQAVMHLMPVQQVVSSPLSRCVDFAMQQAQRWQVPCSVDEPWQEYNFGDWDGLPWHEIEQRDGECMRAFFANPWQQTPINAETMAAFDARINCAWRQVLEGYRGQSVLVVTHAGVMKQLLSSLWQLPKQTSLWQQLYLPFAALISIQVTRDREGLDWIQVHWPSADKMGK